MGDMGALKLTTQKFYRVNGGSTQLEGVKSDVVMPDRYSYFEVGERDYDNPLPYDKIDAAEYDVWNDYIDYEETISKSVARMAKSDQLICLPCLSERWWFNEILFFVLTIFFVSPDTALFRCFRICRRYARNSHAG